MAFEDQFQEQKLIQQTEERRHNNSVYEPSTVDQRGGGERRQLHNMREKNIIFRPKNSTTDRAQMAITACYRKDASPARGRISNLS